MKNEKQTNNNYSGFTLIELLAIIVILAIIAVITVPIVLNIIDNSRKGAAKNSAYGYKEAIDKYYVGELQSNKNLKLTGIYEISDGVLNGTGINNINIPLSGTKPASGTLTYLNNKLTNGCLVIDEYAVIFNDGIVTKTERGDCKTYENQSCLKVTYDINIENCVNMMSSYMGEEAEPFCKGESTYMGMTIKESMMIETGVSLGIDFDYHQIRSFLNQGLIENVQYTKTCDACFSYNIPKSIKSYDFNCPIYLNLSGITDEEQVTSFCNGESEIYGMTYEDLSISLDESIESISTSELNMLISAGALSNLEYEESDEIEIADFYCYEGNPFELPEYQSFNNIYIPNTVAGKKITSIVDTFSNRNFTGNLDLTNNTNLRKINSGFSGNNITNLVIPNSVTEIGSHAFADNNIISVTLGNSVTSIGEHAFSHNNITDLTIPDSVTEIGSSAFEYNNIISVTLGNSVTSIGSWAFSHNNITDLTIPDSVTEIEDNAFNHNNIINLTLGNSATSIGSSAFSHNDITDLTIPSSVQSIGDYAFSDNDIIDLTIPNNVTEIGVNAFSNNNITDLTISNGVQSIGEEAFKNNNISSLTIPNSVQSIGGLAFAANTPTSNHNLTTIYNDSGRSFDWASILGLTASCTFETGTCSKITITKHE